MSYYLIFTFSQQIYIWMAKGIPWLHLYHSAFAVLSFCSFVMNDTKAFYDTSDHVSLMIGFVAISFISSMFLSVCWINSAIGLSFSIGVVAYYFIVLLNYRMITLALSLTLVLVSNSYISYYVELQRKKLFL